MIKQTQSNSDNENQIRYVPPSQKYYQLLIPRLNKVNADIWKFGPEFDNNFMDQ